MIAACLAATEKATAAASEAAALLADEAPV